MKNSVFFGENLKFLLNQKNISQKDFSDILNKGQSTVSGWINKGFIPKIDTLEKISSILEIDLYDMLLLDLTNNCKKNSKKTIPIIGEVVAGNPILADENVEGYFQIDNSVNADFALKVKGDSMIEYGIFDKDIAFIKRQDTIEQGEVGVVLVLDNLTGQMVTTLKKIVIKNDKVHLIPYNSNLSPLIYDSKDVKIVGKLVASFRNFK